jgi:Astacin (Peptidase family M12A)
MPQDWLGSGEFRSSAATQDFSLTLVEGASITLKAAAVNGRYIFEGDIAIAMVTWQEGTVIVGQQYRWPNALVPYEIDSALPSPDRVTGAIAEWEAKTKVRFVARTQANAAQYANYVHFQDQGGCFSSVGMAGGMQIISLGQGCTKGNAIHEIGHTLGLWHEQSRKDRDSFVTIVWQNIDVNLSHNFDQHVSDGDDIGQYDYGSIMHYPRNAFSINGQDTIIPKQEKPIGQREKLSQGDIAAVQQMYP